MPPINPTGLQNLRSYAPQGPGVTKLTDAELSKKIDNGVSEISFFKDQGPVGAKAHLAATPSKAEDKGRIAKVIEATGPELESIKADPAKFETLLKATIAAKKSYLYPTQSAMEGVKTLYQFNNIVGQRVDQFAAEAIKLANELYPAGEKRNAALKAANFAIRDLMSRDVKFDNFEINGYGSFGHDAAFIHVYEKQLEGLNKINLDLLTPEQKASVERAKKQIQGELDDIFRHKYVYHSSNMQETDAEKTIGLVAIDKGSRQRISEKASSAESVVPEFEVLKLGADPVFYDSKKKQYFKESGGAALTESEIGSLSRTAVSADEVTFRRATAGETLRDGFRFDWNGDGYVQQGVIDWVSWGGHCNDKAQLEAAGVIVPEGHKGVTEYNSASGATMTYSRDLLNEALLSFSEFGAAMSRKTGGDPVKSLVSTEYASARDDDKPDRIALSNGRSIPFNSRPNEFEIQKVTKDGKTYSAADIFGEYKVAADKMSAEKNPLYKGVTEGDYVKADLAGAVIEARAKVQTFDLSTGYPTFETQTVKLDFANPGNDPIVIDSVMRDAAKREIYEISLDLKKSEWRYDLYRFEKQPDGKFKKVKVAAPDEHGAQKFDPKQLVAMRETSLDAPSTYMPFVEAAMKTGLNGTAETADGSGVWNGRMLSLSRSLDKREGNWERVNVSVDARYGSNDGQFLAKLNDKGEYEYMVPLKMVADFFWRQPVAFAPEADGLVNGTALARGAISVSGGTVHADAISDLMEVLYAAFAGKNYSILHDGYRYTFDTKEQFEAEVAKLETLRKQATGEAGGPVVEPHTPIKIQKAGALAKNEEHKLETIEAKKDGIIRLTMTGTGDADLHIKTNGPVSRSSYDHRPYLSTSEETVELHVKKGDKINVMIHGYNKATYDLKIEEQA